ncbi:SMC-Scp complex subunit ScpB [Longivirga aurantiaca]|uniref:SMC-Scp complex subunit ScpB n=1 Tax=Longivirga aurantiaca TaxID=1837743 RepID=A0ABW1T2S8_9ACTN
MTDPDVTEQAQQPPVEALEAATTSEDAPTPPEAAEAPARASERPAADADEASEPDGTDEDDQPSDTLGAPTLDAALEAVLLVTDEPLDIPTLATIVRRTTAEVEEAVRSLSAGYAEAGRGFDLREVAGGWRFYTRADCSEVVERFVRDGQQAKLTQAALETLAVVAYRQPVSRARISAVRGVNVDGVIRTLTSRGLIGEAGHDPTSQAILYRTTDLFLERLGITDLAELPPVADYLPDIELLDALADEM